MLPSAVAEAYIETLLTFLQIIPPEGADLKDAMRLNQQHGLQFFDALLLSTAARAGCSEFYSEDLQHGRSFGAMQVMDPFKLNDLEFDQFLT